jgi:DeoR family fructose operon transcriptional repressor
MQMRSRAVGAILEMIDASQDMAQEVDALRNAIGKSAAQFVNAGDTIILDAGTTTAYLARALQGRENITVITNSLRVLAELKDEAGITLVSSGGIVRRESQALVDSRAEAAFQHLRVDKAFVSTTGLSLEFGLSNTNMAEAAVKRAMIAAARETILLADSSKLGVESLVRIAPIEKVSHLITDSAISSRYRLALAQKDITVTIAEEAPLMMG